MHPTICIEVWDGVFRRLRIQILIAENAQLGTAGI